MIRLKVESELAMHLINFDNVDAINELLERIGITAELGVFLREHLTQVLRQQHPDVVIQSVGIKIPISHGCKFPSKQSHPAVYLKTSCHACPDWGNQYYLHGSRSFFTILPRRFGIRSGRA